MSTNQMKQNIKDLLCDGLVESWGEEIVIDCYYQRAARPIDIYTVQGCVVCKRYKYGRIVTIKCYKSWADAHTDILDRVMED